MEGVSLANEFGVEERWLGSYGQKIKSNNNYSAIVKKYWQRSLYLPFPDIPFAEMKSDSVKNDNTS